jgi:uncharacterized membrane protein YgdD (TMEM256/DUF423 family)
MNTRLLILTASFAGGTGVLAGAFGAHGLRARITPDMLTVFEVGVRYQMYHALALLFLALLSRQLGSGAGLAGWCFSAGIVVFSGSLYLLALTGLRWWGAITPIGGVCFLAGWGFLFLSAIRNKSPDQ